VSIGARVPIVAAIITLILAPGGPGQRKPVKAKMNHLRCVRSEPIPDSRRARQLDLVGVTCRHLIVRARHADQRR
jgi:hypothetical protein